MGYPPTWELPSLPMLWRYSLHYHDFLWVLSPGDALAVALDWIRTYPNAKGRVGWDPYPISLRIQNWCMYFFGRHRSVLEANSDRRDEFWRSIYEQLHWLERHVEHHLLGNHIIENAAAFAMAGATFGGRTGERWLETGLSLLRKHLPEIVLSDGGHAERSPMYHARLCQLVENLSRTGNDRVVDAIEPYGTRIRAALALLCHPDGEIALLNDAAFGVYPRLDELGVETAGTGPFALPLSGYYGAVSSADHYVVCDAGPIGPAYQPGHAHGDTLSFELSIAGLRFAVDSGVFGYEADSWRDIARSTRAHNTVEVNRVDQSDFWAAFRVGRRARPRHVVHEVFDGGFSLEAEHTGYDHLPGRPVHRRRFRWYQEGILLVRDRLQAARPVWTRSHIHLHPEVSVEVGSDRLVRLRRRQAFVTIAFAGRGRLLLEPSWYFPEFGRRVENRVLVLTARGADVRNGFCIAAGSASLQLDLQDGAVIDGKTFGW